MNEILSSLNGYISDFCNSGFSPKKSEAILELCRKENTLLSHVISVFGCGSFDTACIISGLLVSVSAEAAHNISSLFGVRPGYISPEAVSALFFGTKDIVPFISSLQKYSPLSRLMKGTECLSCAEMQLCSFASDFLINGVITDDTFIHYDNSDVLVPLASQQRVINELSSFIGEHDIAEPFIIRITGEYGSGRRSCVKKALDDIGLSCVFIDFIKADDIDISQLSAKLLLMESIPVLISDGISCSTIRKLSDEVGLVILISENNDDPLNEEIYSLTVLLPPTSISEQYMLWQHDTKDIRLSDGTDLSVIAGEFEMNPRSIKQAVSFAKAFSSGDTITEDDLKNGCARSFNTDMGSKAVKLPKLYSWDDIIIPQNSRRMLSEACQQVRLRHKVLNNWGFFEKMPYGNGVSMIFTGPPGTGKTMAAQIIAGELGMDIYKISLANVVSKYIGETEKNLNEIFDKAKRCWAILFFDEADVLFSKRTEVKESNDKYSNMESAFLLQKTEEYNGIVILATNFVQNFDEAFKRRMRFLIDFPLPDASLRRQIWLRAFPEAAPKEKIDFDYLSERFSLSGSNIRNIVLHSAYLAAAEKDSAISMKHIIPAIRNEYTKIGKSFTKADAGEYYFELPEIFREE